MNFTAWRENFVDHHFLYHILLVPFVWLGNGLYAVKLSAVFFPAIFITIWYWFWREQGNKQALLFTLLPLLNEALTFRLALVKANSLSLIFLLLVFFALQKNKNKLLAVLCFLYVWAYGGWVIAPLAVGLWCLIFWQRKLKKIRPLFYALAGTLLGLIINPYFPANLNFYWLQIVDIGLINHVQDLNAGREWYPYAFSTLVSIHALYFAVLTIILVACRKDWCRISRRSIFYSALALIGFLLAWKSMRYIELSVPLVILAFGSLWQDLLPNFSWSKLTNNFWQSTGKINRRLRWYAGIIFLILLPLAGFYLVFNLARPRINMLAGFPLTAYQQEALWLAEHTPEKSIIVHSDWGEWPELFYYNTHNHYIVGLDPTFMYRYDPQLFRQWADFTMNKSTQDPRQIMEKLQSEYLLVSFSHAGLIKTIDQNTDFETIFIGTRAKIYQLKN